MEQTRKASEEMEDQHGLQEEMEEDHRNEEETAEHLECQEETKKSPKLPTKYPENFEFFALPAEIRNEVYKLLVVGDDSEIAITQRLPTIAQVSRQLRNESLAIFLGYNSFVVTQIPEKIDFLVHWLATIGSGSLRYLKRLSLDCSGGNAGVYGNPPRYHADFRGWHQVVACLAAFDLRQEQLRWTWTNRMRHALSEWNMPSAAAGLYFCAMFTLNPLLNHHGLLAYGTSSLNILTDLDTVSKSADQEVKSRADAATSKIKATISGFSELRSTSAHPRRQYDEHIKDIFKESPTSLGRFYDLKYLLNTKEGIPNYKDTPDFQNALQSAIGFHRGRYQHQREWEAEQNRGWPVTQLQRLPSTFTPAIRMLSNPSARPNKISGTNNTVDRSWYDVKAFEPLRTTASVTSTLTKPTPKFSMFGDEVNESKKASGESPFANIQMSKNYGTPFTLGFSTLPARAEDDAPSRSVFEFVIDSYGKRVLRRRLRPSPDT